MSHFEGTLKPFIRSFLMVQEEFRKKYLVCQDPGSGKHLISCLDQSLFIQTSWPSAGIIRCLAKLGSVVDESILTSKAVLTRAILEGLAEYGRFN